MITFIHDHKMTQIDTHDIPNACIEYIKYDHGKGLSREDIERISWNNNSKRNEYLYVVHTGLAYLFVANNDFFATVLTVKNFNYNRI